MTTSWHHTILLQQLGGSLAEAFLERMTPSGSLSAPLIQSALACLVLALAAVLLAAFNALTSILPVLQVKIVLKGITCKSVELSVVLAVGQLPSFQLHKEDLMQPWSRLRRP